MDKIVELPLLEPIYSTYHNALGSAMVVENPTIKNWYFNEVMNLVCQKQFLYGYTSPKINIVNVSIYDNPYLARRCISMGFLQGQTNAVIRNLLSQGYYIYFTAVDDYYVKGKSWYKERHFEHDGAICGYNQIDKTFCIYAYDSNWIYQKFWTPQKCFNEGRKSMFKQGRYGNIWAIKPKMDEVKFEPEIACKGIVEYLDSDIEKYPAEGDGYVYGIVVQEYIAKYIEKLFDGSIPYERMDRRVFRLIWEHKKAMLQRIEMIEQSLKMNNEISKQYQSLVSEANTMRMLYASHHMKRRDSVLPIIKRKLLAMMDRERELLTLLIDKVGKEQKDETLELPKK